MLFTSNRVMIPSLKALLILVIGCTSHLLYAENNATKTSDIPTKREFPINTAINPCVNFYEYACSPVIDSFKLRDDPSRHSFAFSDASERLLEFKKKYFLDLAQKAPESAMESEAKNYYLACMNQQSRQK